MIGGACVVAIDGALAVAGPELDNLGIEDNLNTIKNFCEDLISLSPEVELFTAVEPQLEALIEALPGGLAQVAPQVNELAAQIQVSAGT